ncbi:MAG: lipopolysaccharide kinase InaA family protein [Candidatus Brocadiaceae bacterium]|nr:lipopolysaccharide kinase InaA family protein [Candidatus Brocadiaceae bacterium]
MELHCEIIRDGRSRKVLKYTNGQETFYIKHYTSKIGINMIKTFFSPSKAKKEWNQNHLFMKYCLPTATPVALGEKKHHGRISDCYIISREIPHSISVKELLGRMHESLHNNDEEKKNTLHKNIITFIKTVHDRGFFHGELHAENILVNTDTVTDFYLIDLGHSRLRTNLPLSWRIKELSRFLYSILDSYSPDEIHVMIRFYGNHETPSVNNEHLFSLPPVPLINANFHTTAEKNQEDKRKIQAKNHSLRPTEKDIFHKKILKTIQKIKRKRWKSRAKKCLQNNNRFSVAKYGCYTLHKRNEWNMNTLLALIDKHALFLKENVSQTIKVSTKVGITRIPVANEKFEHLCIKEYRYLSPLKGIAYYFFGSPAQKAWFAAHGLKALGFLTPQSVALFETKANGRLTKSFLIMEDISRCLPCDAYVIQRFGNSHRKVNFKTKTRFIFTLANSFKNLHNSGIYHRDLKANNIMVDESNTTWSFFYLDLDRVHFYKKITSKIRANNLSQLNASLPNTITYTDRLRFYRTYAEINNLSTMDKQLIHSIIRKSIQRKHAWNPRVQPAQNSLIRKKQEEQNKLH